MDQDERSAATAMVLVVELGPVDCDEPPAEIVAHADSSCAPRERKDMSTVSGATLRITRSGRPAV